MADDYDYSTDVASAPPDYFHASQPNLTSAAINESVHSPVVCVTPYYAPPFHRLLAIMFASSFALLGVGTNLFLILIFAKPQRQYTVNPLYLIELAICDALLCFVYMLLFGLDPIATYFKFEMLYKAVWTWMLPGFIISRGVQLCIPLWLMYASFERFIMVGNLSRTTWLRHLVTRRARWSVSFVTVTLVFVCRAPMAIVFNVQTDENCNDTFRSKFMSFNNEVIPWYHGYDNIVTVCQVFVPFIVLTVINVLIVVKLHGSRLENRRRSLFDGCGLDDMPEMMPSLFSSMMPGLASQVRRQMREDKARLRSAVLTMAVIITTHLVSNALHVILTILEKVEASILFTMLGEPPNQVKVWSQFYIFYSDMLNFVFMLCSVIRLPIYYVCNAEVRRETYRVFGIPESRKYSSASTLGTGGFQNPSMNNNATSHNNPTLTNTNGSALGAENDAVAMANGGSGGILKRIKKKSISAAMSVRFISGGSDAQNNVSPEETKEPPDTQQQGTDTHSSPLLNNTFQANGRVMSHMDSSDMEDGSAVGSSTMTELQTRPTSPPRLTVMIRTL